jgi:transglutaminase-like putative cysteine protease
MVFMLRPRSTGEQWVAADEFHILPTIQVNEYTDRFGNLCQRLTAPVGQFSIRTATEAMVSDPPAPNPQAGFVEVPRLPDDILGYLLPSRYCESDRFGNMAMEIVGDNTSGYAQVAAISDWVRANIRNTPLSSTWPVSAIEVNQRGEGVCRDLAHMGIALCRALCIPARLVVGYLHELEPMDIHAWFEAYVGDRWYAFDPACENFPGVRLALAHGRDATDVAIYNQYGPLLLPSDMRVAVEKIERESTG